MRVWLATANRWRVSIRGRPCKILLTSSLIAMQNLVVSSSYCVHACRRSQTIWRTLESRPLGTVACLTA